MLLLYSGSGSKEVQLAQEYSSAQWEILKRQVVRFLKGSGQSAAATLLESNAFQLWSGTNDFGDDFELLYLRASLKAYLDFEKQADEHRGLSEFRGIATAFEKLNRSIRFIAVDVEIGDDTTAVEPPDLKISSAVVDRALTDAAMLIKTNGPVSGLDRVHTALQGYLKCACEEAGLAVGTDPGITDLFKILREGHPKLKGRPHSAEVDQVVRAMATIINVLNPLRNRGSVAHANDQLLEEPEAMLVVNTVRTLLHYFNDRLS